MAENSKIEWTDHTFNPWIGCTKVHAGCAHCYAEAMMDLRYGKVQWGPAGERKVTSDANWRKPRTWNRAAEKSGRPALVFCASLADVFEDRPGLENWRRELFDLIDETPHLIWLMLTKRPENIRRMMTRPRSNVWLGTSPCDQKTANDSIHHLIGARPLAGGLFLSCEPLIGSLNLGQLEEYHEHPGGIRDLWWTTFNNCLTGYRTHKQGGWTDPKWKVDWVIVGGESGAGARPMSPAWVRSIKNQCVAAGVPFFFKQWGEWAPFGEIRGSAHAKTTGDLWACEDGRLIPAENTGNPNGCRIMKVGKAGAGRRFEMQEWSQFPAVFQRSVDRKPEGNPEMAKA